MPVRSRDQAPKGYPVGTKNKLLKYTADGSLTIYVQADEPAGEFKDNWLPAPKTGDFSLNIRTRVAKARNHYGEWTPPSVSKRK